MLDIRPVLLCGGLGKRLYPISTAEKPKAFLSLHSDFSLLQETAMRVSRICSQDPVVVCNREHAEMARAQLEAIDISPAYIIAEDEMRNTAPAVAFAAGLHMRLHQPHQTLWIMPCDHIISNEKALYEAVKAASQPNLSDRIVTFGVSPTKPSEEYGYIQLGRALGAGGAAYDISSFVEKPDAVDATAMMKKGNYLWNSGMFVAEATTLLTEFLACDSDTGYYCWQAMKYADIDDGMVHPAERHLYECPSKPFDKAVMEETRHAAVVKAAFDWVDVGSIEQWKQLAAKYAS